MSDSGAIDSKAGGGADELEALKKHNQTILSEKKKLASDFQEMKAKLEAIEQEKLETQGKFKELNESLKKQLGEKDDKLKSIVKEFGSKTLKSSFAQEAQKAGCLDPEALYKLVDLSTVNVGDDFSFDSEQLKSTITDAQKNRSYLFKKDASAPKDATPNNNKQTSGPLDLSKMKPEELADLLAKKLG
jgi:regulator of replication initiation timing